jgi:glutaredoxin 3
MADVLIYSKKVCPYCVAAKNLLSGKGVTFKEIMVDNDPELYATLKAKTGMMTVPQIFINDKLVGGFNELSALDKSGELDKLLSS